MIYVTFEEGKIKANRFTVTDLKKPFQNIIHTKKIKRYPKPSLYYEDKYGGLLDSPPVYYVRIKTNTFGSLFRHNFNDYPLFWVYETNKLLSPLFRDKVIHKMLDEDLLKEENESISQHIKVIVNLLIKSYNYDAVLTDIKNLTAFTWAVPMIYDDSALVKLPRDSSPRINVLQGILKNHQEGIPLRLLDSQTFDLISLTRHTTFDLEQLEDYNSVLILSGTNFFYSSFIAKKLRTIKRERKELFEPLPVSLFKVI